ncbi:hypothetical protein KM043_016347 [Ampulex compressa]|nr:hypothetical protein KM043_016347 [Ampulex compressa]
MNKHALWADLEEVVEVKEAALVGATSIKRELRRHVDSYFLFVYPSTLFSFMSDKSREILRPTKLATLPMECRLFRAPSRMFYTAAQRAVRFIWLKEFIETRPSIMTSRLLRKRRSTHRLLPF